MSSKLPKTTLEYLLIALIPYSRPNLKLVFTPRHFFTDLEKIRKVKRANARNAYYRSLKKGLIEIGPDNLPRLTLKGRQKIQPFVAKKLGRNAKLMVIFDIPESEAWKRRHLRLLLKELRFQQMQKSVWMSDYDHREILRSEIKEYHLEDYVQIYEAAAILLK
jgi:DNA-binding transcriptional regulator PaaX